MDKAIFSHAMKPLFCFARSRGIAFFLASLLMLFTLACQRYAFPRISPQKIGKIDENGLKNKRFIVHAGSSLYTLSNPVTSSKMLSGTIEPVSEPVYYSSTRTARYTKADSNILNEVHIVLKSKYDSLALGLFSVPIIDVNEVRVIKKKNLLGPIIGVVISLGLSPFVGYWIFGQILKQAGWAVKGENRKFSYRPNLHF